MVARVIRAIRARLGRLYETIGRTACCQVPQPPEGSIPSCRANRSTSNRETQNSGSDIPSVAADITQQVERLFRCTAAITPAGTPRSTAKQSALPARPILTHRTEEVRSHRTAPSDRNPKVAAEDAPQTLPVFDR